MENLDWLSSPGHTQHLTALRSQRRRLLGLTEDIREVQHRLAGLDPSEFWRGGAQRAYRDRIQEIAHELRRVLVYLTEAQEQIGRNIRQLEAEQ